MTDAQQQIAASEQSACVKFPMFFCGAADAQGWSDTVHLRLSPQTGLRIHAGRLALLSVDLLDFLQTEPGRAVREHHREAADASIGDPSRGNIPAELGAPLEYGPLTDRTQLVADDDLTTEEAVFLEEVQELTLARHAEDKAIVDTPLGTAPGILSTARKAIAHRASQRDQPDGERSMARTVAAFNALHGTQLTEVQGWQFMELLKIARSAGGAHLLDDYIDGAAYAALAGEAAERAVQPG